ncbi:Inositol oxygenase [Bagarius yarrelli]|uniref:Inositol oxygenase n=1 Tax=Bagarius yarrelli TaxID=175774 RepID=A0A556VKL7_BAGYA|nr:Inositol oxygenase [Bagarius yarrelli]
MQEQCSMWRDLEYKEPPLRNSHSETLVPERSRRGRLNAFFSSWGHVHGQLMQVGCVLGTRQVQNGRDPSLVYRPELMPKNPTEKNDFRNFQHAEWAGCTHARMTVMETIECLDQLIDESDPDVDFANSFHAFQTAEGIRKEHPDKDWFQLVGLIHDIGKVMALWGEPQWAVVGDTYPVGCHFQDSIVFRDLTFVENPDNKDEKLK